MTIYPTIETFTRFCDVLSRDIISFGKLLAIIRSLPDNQTFVAGGAVRDAFREESLPPKDLDVFLTGNAFAHLRAFFEREGRLERNQFGTYRWFGHEDNGFYYDVIIISNFYNGLWPCKDIIDVLNQFDITANALAFDLKSGAFFDPQNGLRDLNDELLRAVRFDYPELNVSDRIELSRNTVLWFRYIYYARYLQFEVDPLTAAWIEKNSFRAAQLEDFKAYFFNPYPSHV